MFCTHCGHEMEQGAYFCQSCGKPSAFSASTPVKADAKKANMILVFGIISLAISAVAGIVFGSIAMHMAKDYVDAGYPLVGKAKVGSILGKVGFYVGIGTTIWLTLFFIFYFGFFAFIISQILY